MTDLEYYIGLLEHNNYEVNMKELNNLLKHENAAEKTKAIIFSRVSTLRQDLTQQTDAVIDEAHRCGYTDDDLIKIEYKESAIKLAEDERRGLQALYNYIENDDTIKCVFIYEISRLSRQAAMLYEIRDYLIKRNIQLVCLKPYMRLLEDGRMSQTASILFSLFASISESEMMIKQERMMRGKQYKIAQNMNGGGTPLFGYEWCDEKLQLSKRNSNIVRRIYNMYESGKSQLYIAKELLATGEIKCPTVHAAKILIQRTLRREEYTGVRTSQSPYLYPQIITQEQFKRVEAIRNNKHKTYTCTKHQDEALCKNLVFARYNHWSCYPHHGKRVYMMTDYNIEGNEQNYYINIRDLDMIVWERTVQHIKTYGDNSNAEIKRRITKEADICMRKIQQGMRDIQSCEQAIDRIEHRIIDGKMTEARGDAMIAEKQAEIHNTQLIIDKQRYMYNKKMEWIALSSVAVNFDNLDNAEQKNIIHNTVYEILLEKQTLKGHYTIYVIMRDGKQYIYNYSRSGKWMKYKLLKTMEITLTLD